MEVTKISFNWDKRRDKPQQTTAMVAGSCSQEVVFWRGGCCEAFQVGVRRADDVEVSLLHQTRCHRGHQSHRWLGLKQNDKSQHPDLGGEALVQEQIQGDIPDLSTGAVPIYLLFICDRPSVHRYPPFSYAVRVPDGDEPQRLHSRAQHRGGKLHGGGRHAGKEAHDGFDAAWVTRVPESFEGGDHFVLVAAPQALHGNIDQRLVQKLGVELQSLIRAKEVARLPERC